jgi:arsenate reductase (glutaredoxin)
MKLKIYHNPRCAKSRAGFKYLQDKNVEYEVVDYMKNGITEKELEDILLRLHKKPSDIVRTQEELYKKELKGRKFSDHEWMRILSENPKLIQRPIVVARHKAVLAQPPEKIDELL